MRQHIRIMADDTLWRIEWGSLLCPWSDEPPVRHRVEKEKHTFTVAPMGNLKHQLAEHACYMSTLREETHTELARNQTQHMPIIVFRFQHLWGLNRQKVTNTWGLVSRFVAFFFFFHFLWKQSELANYGFMLNIQTRLNIIIKMLWQTSCLKLSF